MPRNCCRKLANICFVGPILAVCVAIGGSIAYAAESDESGEASANRAQAGEPEEIVVTAQKRAENIQTVPISIAAVSGTQLEAAGVTNVMDVGHVVPGFSTQRSAQATNVRLSIRGVGALSGTGVEPSVATFLDDIYVPRPGSLIGRFYDVETVEVMRGPQGTLFGRNASVGAVNIHTREPTDQLEGEAALDGSSYDTYEATGVVNAPLGDHTAVRVAAVGSTTDGFARTNVGDHRIGRQGNYAGRATLRVKPIDGLTWLVRGDYMKITGDGVADNEVKPDTVTPTGAANFAARLGGVVPDLYRPFDYVNNNFVTGFEHDHQYGLTSVLSYEFAGGFTARLIDAMRSWATHQVDGDIIFTPINLVDRDGFYESDSQSHELQIISPLDALLNGRVDFVGGLYYFNEKFNTGEDLSYTTDFCNRVISVAAPKLLAPCLSNPLQDVTVQRFHQNVDSAAAYTQFNLKLTDELKAVLGGRYTHDQKSGRFVQAIGSPAGALFRAPEDTPLSFGDGQFTWRANLSYTPTKDMLLFANYSTGFKSGGFNSGGGTLVLGQRRIFNSETVKNYELGVKSTSAGGRAVLNATLYRMDVHNLQDRAFDGVSLTVRNAADLRQQGVEFDGVVRPFGEFRLNAAAAYLDSGFLRYPNASGLPAFGGTQDLKGKPATYSPKWQGSVGAQYDFLLGGAAAGYNLSLRSDLSFISDSNIGLITDNNPQTVQPAYQLVSARLTLYAPSDRWSIAAYGDNLFDKGYCTSIFAQTLDSIFGVRNPATGGTLMRCTVGTPRMIGARVEAKF